MAHPPHGTGIKTSEEPQLQLPFHPFRSNLTHPPELPEHPGCGRKLPQAATGPPVARSPPCSSPTVAWTRACVPGGTRKGAVFLAVSTICCRAHGHNPPHSPGKEPPHEGVPWEGAAQLADAPQGAVGPLLACPGGSPRPGVVRPPHHLNSASPQALSPTPQAYLPLGMIIFILFVLFSYKAWQRGLHGPLQTRGDRVMPTEPDPQNEAPGLSLLRAEEKQGSIAPAEDTGIIPTPLIRFRELQTPPPQDPPPWHARNCTSFSSLVENERRVPEKEDRTCHRRNPCSDLCSALPKLSEPHFPHLNSRDD